MAWFKMDDKLHDHRKTRKALRGPKKRRDVAPMGLWALAGSWAADNLTNGFVPADEIDRWDDHAPALAARLVDAGFWHPGVDEHGEKGFWFHEWEERQPTREQVEAKREQARERMRNVRANGGRGSRDVRANTDGTSQEVGSTPSRPDPAPSLVTSSRHLQTVPAGLADDDLDSIAAAVAGDRPHAAKVAADILARATEPPRNVRAYVLRAVGDDPARYRMQRRLTRDLECDTHPGQFADACNGCAADRKAAR